MEEKADSEPEFQYIPEKCPQDPTQIDQHALRDSMVTLKEGLSSGAILAQFDVRGALQLFNDIFICKHVIVCGIVFLQQLYRKRPGMTMLCAKLPQNVSKNRYRDISPCTASQAWTFSQPLSRVLPLLSPPRVIFSVCAVSAPLFVSLCRWCHTGHSEKHRWLHQCKLHQCECLRHVLFLSFNMSVDISVSDWELVGCSVSLTYETQGKTLTCHWWIHQTSPINHSLYPVNMKDGTYSDAYCQQYILFRLT